MILGTHLVFGAYGFWLPNDPRGSWSEFVGSLELRRFGPATKTTGRRSVAHRSHDRALRLAAKQALKHGAVEFTGVQARAVGRGFAEYVEQSKLLVWACAIMPDHVHLVLARHSLKAESVAIQLKGHASHQLQKENLHPFGDLKKRNGRPPKCFARGEWKAYLDSIADIVRAVEYVEANPEKESKPRQRWPFVKPFDPSAV
jgi:REP element-mobilizing transposase RayT